MPIITVATNRIVADSSRREISQNLQVDSVSFIHSV